MRSLRSADSDDGEPEVWPVGPMSGIGCKFSIVLNED